MSTAVQIKRNIRDYLASLSSALVPSTTLTADAVSGVPPVILHVTPLLDAQGRSRIREGGYLTFYDSLGERTLPVQTVSPDGSQVTLNTMGLKDDAGALVTGLQYTHTSGTRVYGNLTAFVPWSITIPCELGDPSIVVTVRRKHANVDFMPAGGFGLYVVDIRYDRLYSRPSDLLGMDANLWTQQQEDAVMADVETIETALLRNQGLITDWSPAVAEKFAPLNSSKDLIVIEWGWTPVQGDALHFTATMTCAVLAQGVSFR